MEEQECSRCKQVKPMGEFRVRKNTRTNKYCNVCILDKHYLRYYGINYIDYLIMYKKQDGKCSICFELKDKLVIDHCHNSKNIRGLLCNNCNVGLGYLKDNIEILGRSIKYLQNSEEKNDIK